MQNERSSPTPDANLSPRSAYLNSFGTIEVLSGIALAWNSTRGGGDHLHAYAEWADRLDVRDERHFDVDGQHPNVQPVRNRASVLKYCQKGGDFVGNCEATSSTTVRYGDLVRSAGGRRDFLEQVVQHYPRDAVLHLERVQQFAEWRWPEERVAYIPSHTTFRDEGALVNWKAENLDVEVLIYIPLCHYGCRLRSADLANADGL